MSLITTLDPVAQTFIINKENYPEGLFLSSIKLFFVSKPINSNIPVILSIVGTTTGIPSGKPLDYSRVVVYPNDVKVSETPHYLDSNTYTEFKFSIPVYIRSDILYAMVIQSNSSEYKLWVASQNDLPISSSVKELPTSATPTELSKIAKSPYVGSFFESQNGLSYTPDQTKDLMFVINRCKFSNTANPNIGFSVISGLQKFKHVETNVPKFTSNVWFDEMNLSTTHFVPTNTRIDYNYTSTRQSTGDTIAAKMVIPGEYGTPLPRNITFDDNLGSRMLVANSNTSFILTAGLRTLSDKVSPVLADDGLRLFVQKYFINDMSISNNNISIQNGGTGYANGALVNPDVVVSEPDEPNGVRAEITANVISGVISNVYVTSTGSGYTKTPTVTITAANTTSATIVINGETDATGGNGLARYITYPTTLAQGADSGDLRVYFTAYRPTGTNVHVYYKILARGDTQTFEDGDWKKMTLIEAATRFSITRNDLYEYIAAPGESGVADNEVSYTSKETSITYETFYKYAIKVVLSSSDSTRVPVLKDIRVLALPRGTDF
jgi:hypothetical protein